MFDQVSTHHYGRRFWFTSGGQMALLPAGARKGDKLCLLYGVQLPLAARPSDDGYHDLIRTCYIHQY
jgi:hypothetical protein